MNPLRGTFNTLNGANLSLESGQLGHSWNFNIKLGRASRPGKQLRGLQLDDRMVFNRVAL